MSIATGRVLPHSGGLPQRLRSGLVAAAAFLLAASLAAPALAQTGGGFDLTWNTIDCGGATFLNAGVFALGGTAGQPDAGLLSGGVFSLGGGFWAGGLLVATSVPPASNPEAPAGNAVLAFALHPSRPNPFNPKTEISFDLPSTSPVSLVIYDVRGERVRALVHGPLAAGRNSVAWDGTNDAGVQVASGTYFLRLVAAGRTAVQKLVVTK